MAVSLRATERSLGLGLRSEGVGTEAPRLAWRWRGPSGLVAVACGFCRCEGHGTRKVSPPWHCRLDQAPSCRGRHALGLMV